MDNINNNLLEQKILNDIRELELLYKIKKEIELLDNIKFFVKNLLKDCEEEKR